MNPEQKSHWLITLALALGLLLVGFASYMQAVAVKEQTRKLDSLIESLSKSKAEEKTDEKINSRRNLGIAEAESRLTELLDSEDASDWNYELDLSKVEGSELKLAGKTFTLPYDSSWGNSKYKLAPYEVSDGGYFFGPMYVSELHGAFREGSVSIIDARSLETALADPEYIDMGCSDQPPTSTARKVRVGSVDAVRYELRGCEFVAVGYEMQVLGNNLRMVSAPQGNDEMLSWVLERVK